MTYGHASVTDSASPIVGANPARAACLIVAVADFYLGDASVTKDTGLLVKAGIPYPIESTAAIYGVTSTGSAVVTYLDQTYGALGPNPNSII